MLPNLLLGYTFYDKAVSVQAFLAFHAGVFRGARLSSLPIFDWCNKFKQNTNADPCLSKNAWFLDHYMNLCHPWWTHFDQYLKVFKTSRVIYGFLFGFCMEYLLKLKGHLKALRFVQITAEHQDCPFLPYISVVCNIITVAINYLFLCASSQWTITFCFNWG